MKLNSPCLKCTKRHISCHDNCTSYKEFKEVNEQVNQERINYRNAIGVAVDSFGRNRNRKFK